MTDRIPVDLLDPTGGTTGQGIVIGSDGRFSISTVGGGSSTTGFHVSAYGAVGDGTTDDTSAIISAIDACVAAGGGDVVFDAKTYLCNGSLRTDRHGNAVIPLPVGRTPIRLIGVAPANQCDPTQDGGRYTIIKTTKTGLTLGSSGVPSLLGGPTDGTWSYNMVSIINICFWLPGNPSIAGVDLRYVCRMAWDGSTVVALNTGASDFAQPTSVYAFGLRTPEEQNYNTVLVKSGAASGMYVGIVSSVESLTLSYWSSKWCKIGWGIWGGGHGAQVGKLSTEWCTYHLSGWTETGGVASIQGAIAGYSQALVSVGELAIEDHNGPAAWYDTVEHIHDPTNQLAGVIFFDRLTSSSAFSSALTVNGAANCKVVPLLAPTFGSALAVKDEGSTVEAAATSVNYVGANVTATSDGSGHVTVTIVGGSSSSGELLMQDGVTGPPVPLENEARSDWLYQG